MTLFDQKRFASVHLQTTFDLKPEPHHIMETMRGTGEPAVPVRYAVYDIKKLSSSDALNVDVKYIQQPFTNGVLPPTVTARRFQTGTSLHECRKKSSSDICLSCYLQKAMYT
jgi:hypothetical protein